MKRLFVESNADELRQLLADKAVESTMPPPLAPIRTCRANPRLLDRSRKLN
jgi:hypothetical protein